MRVFILLIFLISFGSVYGQEDTIAIEGPEPISTATLKSTSISIDLSNAEDVDMALKKIHNYKYLEAVTFENEGEKTDLKKLIYRISSIKNITSVTFKENELEKIPDNISVLKNLQSITIEGNLDLDFNDLCMHLKNIAINQLNLIDNDIKKAPTTLSEISTLKKLQITGSDKIDYADLVDILSRINLSTLSLPLNYLADLPKNIGLLKSLQVLDVSNNDLTELPGEISGLKIINNLSIQGNLLLDPVKDLEKLKGTNIQYLSIDKEISGDDLEKIKKMFPNAQIDFPISKDVEETIVPKKTAEPEAVVHNGELNTKKESLLSGAYMAYPTYFNGIVYNFDTLKFDERYASIQYENTFAVNRVSGRRTAPFFMRNKCTPLEKPGKNNETWFRFALNDPRISVLYPELRAFGGMYWVYNGELSKKKFYKKFICRRTKSDPRKRFQLKTKKNIMWNDVRIEYQKNNTFFTITLKCDTGFIKFSAFPVFPDMSVERAQQTYDRRYILYKKALLRRALRFNRSLARSKRNFDQAYKKVNDYAWKEVQLRMSNEEKAMRKEDWLKYYDYIIAHEEQVLNAVSINKTYLYRMFQIKGYTAIPTTTVQQQDMYGTKNFNIDFIDPTDGSKLVVANILTINNKDKRIVQANGSLGLTPNLIPLKQFTSQCLLIELRNGNWGYISSSELDKQAYDPNKVFQIKTQVFDRNLNSMGELLKDAIK